MPKAIIFDVDGTLVDSVDQHARAWVDAFRDYGHEVEDVRAQIGKGGDQLMPVFLSEKELEAEGEALEKHRGEILKQQYLPKSRPSRRCVSCSTVCSPTARALRWRRRPRKTSWRRTRKRRASPAQGDRRSR